MTPASIDPADLRFMATIAGCASLSAAGRELGVSTAAVSKRLSQLETRLGLRLVVRSTRRMGLTPEGDTFVSHARRILADIDGLAHALRGTQALPSGLLRVNATLGFGRSQIGPLLGRFVRANPGVQAQLQLSVDPPPLTEDAFDVCIRFGPPPDARVMAKRLAVNRRVLCAAPEYLVEHGEPQHPEDLARHRVIGIRQGAEAYGLIRLARMDRANTGAQRAQANAWKQVKTEGSLTSNDGAIAVQWALDGHGIVLRAQWDVQAHLNTGRLVQVLKNYQSPNADIYAVYPAHHQATPRVRAFVDFLAAEFALRPDAQALP